MYLYCTKINKGILVTGSKMSKLNGHHEDSSKMSTKTQTILRIKRRRSEAPVPCLRLEGLTNNNVPTNVWGPDGSFNHEKSFTNDTDTDSINNKNGNDKNNDNNNNNSFRSKRQRTSAVIWKRFDKNSNIITSNHQYHTNKNNNINERGEKYRIVDAVFAADDDDNDNDNFGKNSKLAQDDGINRDDTEENHSQYCGGRRPKRRKLTVLESSTLTSTTPMADTVEKLITTTTLSSTGRKKGNKALKVLDPLSRIVDDSLKEVLVGEKTIEQHYRQLTTDPCFTLRDIALQRKWMTWNLNHSGNDVGVGGNIIHCCALWDDPSIANEILQRFGDISTALIEAVDGDGRTPYEVAEVIGHSRVCEVLGIYGGDTTNYVYDVFYLDDKAIRHNNGSGTNTGAISEGKGSENNHRSHTSGEVGGCSGGKHEDRIAAADIDYDDEEEPIGITTAELTSGIGYWTPDGELILEADDKRDRSLSQEADGDIDSNCEEYEANDYPDEYYEEDQDSNDGYNKDVFHVYDGFKVDNDDGDDDNDNNDEYDWEKDLVDEIDQYRTSSI